MYYLWSLMSVYTFACIGCVYNATATYVCMMIWQCMLLHQCVHDAWAGLSSVHISLNCLCTTVYVRCYRGLKCPEMYFSMQVYTSMLRRCVYDATSGLSSLHFSLNYLWVWCSTAMYDATSGLSSWARTTRLPLLACSCCFFPPQ